MGGSRPQCDSYNYRCFCGFPIRQVSGNAIMSFIRLQTRTGMASKRGQLISINRLPEFTIADDSGRHRILSLDCILIPELRDFQGDNILAYHLLKKYLGEPVDYQISKKALTRCKLYDSEGNLIARELVKQGAAKIDEQEIVNSGLYTSEEVTALKSITAQKTEEVCNAVLHPSLIPKLCDHYDTENCELVGLLGKVVVCKDKTYLPVRLANVDASFDIAEEDEIQNFLNQHRKLQISFGSPYYSLEEGKYCIDATLPLEVEEEILSRGWGVLSPKAQIGLGDHDYDVLSKAVSKAELQFKGIWNNPVDLQSLTRVKENFLAKVIQVDEGNLFLMKKLADGELMTVEVDGVVCPMHEEAGAFEAREFSRKEALGKEFNVYINKQLGFKNQASLVRAEDNQRYDRILLSNGWAKLQQSKASTDSEFRRFLDLQKKFMEAKAGIFSNKLGSVYFTDLTNFNNKQVKERCHALAERFHNLSRFEKSVQTSAVVVKSRRNDIFTIRINSYKTLINFKVEGIESLECNLTIKEVKDFKDHSFNFLRENIIQRDVIIEPVDFDSKHGCFIGYMRFPDGQDVAEVLLEAGLVYADQSVFESRAYAKCEDQAKYAELGLWAPVLVKLKSNKEISNVQSTRDEPFIATISEVINGNTIYYQTAEALAKLEKEVTDVLAEGLTKKLSKDSFKVGNICGAKFTDGLLYRSRIVSKKKKPQNACTILYVDYGNSMNSTFEELYELPEELMKIQDFAVKSRLALVKRLNCNSEVGEACHNEICNMILNKQFSITPATEDSILLFNKSNESDIIHSVNVQIISSGLSKCLDSDLDLLDEQGQSTITNLQQIVKKNEKLKCNIWFDEDEEFQVKKEKGDISID